MTFNDFLPPKTWSFIVQMADENKLSTKEVQRIFLNKVAFDLGMSCNHERIGFAKSNKEPYCKDCWTRLRKEKRDLYRIGDKLIKNDIRYLEKETFLEEFYKDQNQQKERKKTQIENREEGEEEEMESVIGNESQ